MDSGWNSLSLCNTFLPWSGKDQLDPLELPKDIDSLISLSIKMDKRLFERERQRSRSALVLSVQRGSQRRSLLYGVPS